MEQRNESIDLADIITQKPHEFKVGRKLFRLYPVTLAKQLLIKRVMDGLHIDETIMQRNPYIEALRLAEVDRKACCHVLAIHATPNSYKDLHNSKAIAERRNVFEKMSIEDIASMLMCVLTADNTEQVIRSLGLDEERARLQEAFEVKRKNGKNNLTFGGLTIFGSFIGQLKEMGYTDNEIIYEKGYTFLRLMLADKVTSIYMSDEELQDLSISAGGSLIDGNSPDAFDKLKESLPHGLRIKE